MGSLKIENKQRKEIRKTLKDYLKNLHETTARGDAREESYYQHLSNMVKTIGSILDKKVEITILPKKTEAGNPDFRVWDGQLYVTGYIEAKKPGENLDIIQNSEQIKRYLNIFPNLVLTNFYEFRLYKKGKFQKTVLIGNHLDSVRLNTPSPLRNENDFIDFLGEFLSFSIPKITKIEELTDELAKRTRFLRDEVILVEVKEKEENEESKKQILGFYDAFKEFLIKTLDEKQFADLFAQTITYGLFVAKLRAEKSFNRKLASEFIPSTIGILKDIFNYISMEKLPEEIAVIIDDISAVLNSADIKDIFMKLAKQKEIDDPIIHFYEPFLEKYDKALQEKRGVYYTPYPVVKYIVRAVHQILKSHFNMTEGLASKEVKLLDPASGTATFPVEAIKVAADEFIKNYGNGSLNRWIKEHILTNYFAFELMMAPYTVGHLKINFVLEELGYKMDEDERFKLYLTNSLEAESVKETFFPGLRHLSEENKLADKVKKDEDILVIIGNPPYSGISSNINEWTEKLLKEDIDRAQSYYKVDGKPLGEKKLWLQDDYVKFLRFAQWKIRKKGFGIVGMITNHSYLDNPTFRGMRQSLMKTFDEIYILNLHGNSLKRETAPDGGKDENVFDIRQGVAIALFIRNKNPEQQKVYYSDLYGLREEKYRWLRKNNFEKVNYEEIKPASPWYFFVPRSTGGIQYYLDWKKINEIFPVNVTGIVTARDKFVIGFSENEIRNRILQFKDLSIPDEIISQTYKLKDTRGWKLPQARRKLADDPNWDSYYQKILYRPFDVRTIYYTPTMVDWGRPEVMRHMMEENIGLICSRLNRQKSKGYFFITSIMADFHILDNARDSSSVFPLYLYPDKTKTELFNEQRLEKEPNIAPVIFKALESVYNKKLSPEDILYYIYAVFYSNIYREKYAEFLKIDFPRVPFTKDYELFKKMGVFGEKLVNLHLLKSDDLNPPIARYQGKGDNDFVKKIEYDESEGILRINEEKYFEGITPEVWNYHIGGYQVLNKYLKDRKGRSLDDPILFCKIATAISKTIEIQKEIDKLYSGVEKDLIEF